eukprot:1093016-Pelagomonas_calceolata.AAC.1
MMVHTSPYNCLAVPNLAAAVYVGPRLPIYNLGLEIWEEKKWKEKKNYTGSENTPHINLGTGDT